MITKKQKNSFKKLRVGAELSIDARTLKALIIHLSTRINLIQYFRFFSTFI